jgi:hypothetical protein
VQNRRGNNRDRHGRTVPPPAICAITAARDGAANDIRQEERCST